MKIKEIKELHQKKIEELKIMLEKIAKEIVNFRMEKQSGKLKNVSLLNKKKREVARIKTIIKEKEINL
ncbi:MAG: 50S ribosomal protein L29 [Candidatus Shapirobacteria bacterium]|nr:50S ribosomal protein L29 [Candidatus Shapirobacteria bacterium]